MKLFADVEIFQKFNKKSGKMRWQSWIYKNFGVIFKDFAKIANKNLFEWFISHKLMHCSGEL